MGKTYHRNKPADVDRSHAFKPAKTKMRLNARDVYAALDETADERTNIIPTSDEQPHAPGVRAEVLVRDDRAIIPDLDVIESMVVEALAA